MHCRTTSAPSLSHSGRTDCFNSDFVSATTAEPPSHTCYCCLFSDIGLRSASCLRNTKTIKAQQGLTFIIIITIRIRNCVKASVSQRYAYINTQCLRLFPQIRVCASLRKPQLSSIRVVLMGRHLL